MWRGLDPYRAGEVEEEAADSDEATGVEASEPDSEEAASETKESPEKLVLHVRGREIDVADGDGVGREVRCALTETGGDEDDAMPIHREHVQFVREDDQFYLEDLGENPTTLEGRSLQKGDCEPVAPGDKIGLSGVVTLTVQEP